MVSPAGSTRGCGFATQPERQGAAALVPPLGGVVDEDVAHQPGRQRKEVRAALQRHPVHIDETQEDLVDERCRLARVAGTLPPEMAARHAPQIVIQQRNQPVERRGVSLSPGQEELGDVTCG
ncbi:MAG TPA: hypothetical protein VLD67_02715 [Vicinamibacterales bacterium]|nr:hypothetical protein [Vicinamibacterales bacterium]